MCERCDQSHAKNLGQSKDGRIESSGSAQAVQTEFLQRSLESGSTAQIRSIDSAWLT